MTPTQAPDTLPVPLPEPERTAFEAWAETTYGPLQRDTELDYFYTDVRAAWRAWKAAKADARACMAPLQEENAKLKTVMIAAAEEIHAHWDAHCDAEGYGPQNLQRRLEEGIPSEYGYTAGAFKALQARADALQAEVEQLRVQLAGCGVASVGNTRESWNRNNEVKQGVYGWSASYADCLKAAKREIDHRERADALEEALKEFYRVTESGVDGGLIDMQSQRARIEFYDRLRPVRDAARSLINPTGGES